MRKLSWNEISWLEQTQLVKDILWFFNDNEPLSCSFVPRDCFILKYWEYLPLTLDMKFNHYDLEFIREGCLIMINAIINEYIPIHTGVQKLFLETPWKVIMEFVNQFNPSNNNQEKLKEITLLGLKLADETDLTKDKNEHQDFEKYIIQTIWIDKIFIQEYFNNKSMKYNLKI
jgi:hypothetical protein